MGTDCSTCCGNEGENQSQVKSDIFNPHNAKRIRGQERIDVPTFTGETPREQMDRYAVQGAGIDDLMKLVRVQSLVRGFLAKKQYKIQKTHNEGTTKYFKSKES